MTQEEKQLILKDLCTREPYHPRIQVFNQGYEGFQDGEFDTNLWLHHIDAFRFDRIEVLPYLRPMSSMTEEELKEFSYTILQQPDLDAVRNWQTLSIDLKELTKVLDWLNKKHFDYNDLIEKGLALEALKDMYKKD